MIRHFQARLLQLVLAIVVVVPGAVAMQAAEMTTAHASGVCYWSGTYYDTVYDYPASGVTYASTVGYQIGYDCNLNRAAYYVSYIGETLNFSYAYSWAYHASTAAAVCGYTDSYGNCQWVHWYNGYTSGPCAGACTTYRYAYPYVTLYPYSTVAVWDHWVGCDYGGYGWCETTHYFATHRVSSYWGG